MLGLYDLFKNTQRRRQRQTTRSQNANLFTQREARELSTEKANNLRKLLNNRLTSNFLEVLFEEIENTDTLKNSQKEKVS
jgi:hypothetical protein